MRSPTLDAMAGETARAARMRPGAPRPITDPTNPRYGMLPAEARRRAAAMAQIVDPTDPRCGEWPD